MLDFSLFGISYTGADICGFFQDTTYELCARWMQLGAFYPFSRNHNGKGSERQDPVYFDENFKNLSRNVLNTRYTLLPYLYTLLFDAHTKGTTVVRPLLHEFIDDKQSWDVYKQFLWGPAFLISPVLEQGATTVEAYIPNTRWYDYYTGVQVSEQGKWVVFQAPLEYINLHVRGGYILPWQKPANNTHFSRQNLMGLLVALDETESAHGQLFWDDGKSIDSIEKGIYIAYEFSAANKKITLTPTNTKYTDPNNVKFEEIKIFGLPKNISVLIVKKGGNVQPSTHQVTYDEAKQVAHITGLQLVLGESYTLEWNQDLLRFDCHPEDDATEAKCGSRGCIWAIPDNPMAPFCYYPSDYGYSVNNVVMTAHGLTADLHNAHSFSRYGESSPPIDTLRLTVTYHENNMLQFKISDPNNKRYEVPVPLKTPTSPMSTEPGRLYDVEIVNNPFGIKIKRRSSGTVIWDSQVPGFTFSDMFIQISTQLPSEYIYGLGETEHRTFRHELNWVTWGLFAKDQPGGYKLNSYGVHPFYMGLEQDGNAHGVFLLNSNAMDVTVQPTPALTYRTIGGILDFYVVLGPTPEMVVKQYTTLIGRPVMPAYWSLGFQLCRYGYKNDMEISELYNEMKAAQIPYDVQYADIDYMERQMDFTLSQNFSGLPALFDHIKSEGMRCIIMLDPAIAGNETKPYEAFTRGRDKDVFIKYADGSGIVWGKVWPDLPDVYVNTSLDWDTQVEIYRAHTAFPDFFKNGTAEWWHQEIKEFRENKSIKFDGIWIDMNEPASFVHGSVYGCKNHTLNFPPYMPPLESKHKGLNHKTICMDSQQLLPDGTPVRHYDVHSLYGWSHAKPTYDALRNLTGERGIVVSRSTYPSAGQWVGHWLGDNTAAWSQMDASIIGMMEFSLFGISYTGADICGFFENTTYNLCARWMQLGAFYPYSRNHNGIEFRRQDPVSFDERFKNLSRNVLNIRYRLLPYLYTLMFDAHTEGSTVIRPLLHEFVADKTTWDVYKQFLWGPAFMISPVLEDNQSSVNAYIPNTRWYDYYTGLQMKERGKWVTLPAPLEHINLHVRGGYIIPWQEPANNTFYSRKKFMGLIVALDDNGEAQGNVFWDDGQSIDSIEKKHYFQATYAASVDYVTSQVTHNNYLTAANPLYLGHVYIWGTGKDAITHVAVTYAGKTEDILHFTSQNEVLEIHLTDKSYNLENVEKVAWHS
ncbi:hypothetical protein FKM82_004095 [Ascaphus truei]